MTFVVKGPNHTKFRSDVSVMVASGANVLQRARSSNTPPIPFDTRPPVTAELAMPGNVKASTAGSAVCIVKYTGKIPVCSVAKEGRGRTLNATGPAMKLWKNCEPRSVP